MVFTGKLERLTRADAERLASRHGWRVAHAVTHGTDLVVAGSSPGTKLDRARTLGIQVLPERAFLRRLTPAGVTP